MAKSDSLINLQGTIGGLTFVKSRAYGDHVRAKRGTYKKAELNQAMKEGSAKLKVANVHAKIFKDAIDPHRVNIVDGTFWQRLLSLFRRQLNTGGAIDFSQMVGFEIHSRHTSKRFIQVNPTIKFNRKKFLLEVDLHYSQPPTFKKSKYVDGYRLTIIGVFPDMKKKRSKTESMSSSIVRLTAEDTSFRADLGVPSGAKKFIVCVKIEGCGKGIVFNTRTTSGLWVVGGGEL
jgi:hypothetical protein